MDCEHQGVAVGATRTGVTRAAGQREGGVGRSKNSMNHPMKHNTNAQERQKEDTQTTHLATIPRREGPIATTLYYRFN